MRALLIGLGLLLQAGGSAPVAIPASIPPSIPSSIKVQGMVGAHDPSIAREGATYYVFATGRAPGGGQLPIRCSEDLQVWRMCGRVFDALPGWIASASPGTRDLWAPDISFTHGEYRLYYAYSLFGKQTSGIALATNRMLDPASPEYKWVDKGLVLSSSAADDFNAIDPAYIEDKHGRGWLAFGSFWTGIKMRAIDTETGLPARNRNTYSLARREDGGHAVEAPYVLAHGGRYYLFASFDLCCRGARSTYRTMVGRSSKVTGPYVDASGRKMMDGGGTEVLVGNAMWAGPGGESAMHDGDRDLMVFHAYDAITGKTQLQVSTIAWVDGWPRIALEGAAK